MKVSLLTLLSVLLLPSAGVCLPEGGGSVSFFNRYSRQETSVSPALSLTESLIRLDLFQVAPGYGTVFSSMDLTRVDSSASGEYVSLSRRQFGIEGFRLGGWDSTLIAGDTSIRFTNLLEGFPGPALSLRGVKPVFVSPFDPGPGRFTNTTYQDINLRGGTLSSVRGTDSLLLFAGSLATPRGFQSNEFVFDGESLYGVKWAHRWQDNFSAGIGIARTFDQIRTTASGVKTVNNTIFLLDGAYRLNQRVNLITEFKGNLFDQDGSTLSGCAFKTGPIVTLPDLRAELNFRYVGPDFIFFKETLQPERDVEGVFATVDYRLRNNLTLYSSLDWSKSNLHPSAALPEIDTLSLLAGGYYAHPVLPSINLRLSLTDQSSSGSTTAPVNSDTFAAYLEATKTFGPAIPYLRFSGDVTSDKTIVANTGTGESVVTGVRFVPAQAFNFYLEGEGQFRQSDGGGTNGFKFRAGALYAPIQRLSLAADTEYSAVRDSVAATTQKSFIAGGSVYLTLAGQVTLSADIRYNSGTNGAVTTTHVSNLLCSLALTKSFGWGRQLPRAYSGQGSVASVGDITGYVFQDLNNNGVKDDGEPGLAGIAITLEDGTKALTDQNGRYLFSDVTTGTHLVKINEKKLPASFNLLSNASHRVEVDLRSTAAASFPLILSGSVRGRVLVDSNDTGRADAGDAALPDILIYFAGTQINTFSDADGNFAIENLVPGRYEVTLDTVGLAAGMKLLSPEKYAVTVRAGEQLSDLIFLVTVEKRTVIKKIFGRKPGAEKDD